MQAGGSCFVTPKHEVPFWQLTSTLLSLPKHQMQGHSEDCGYGLQARWAVWAGWGTRVCRFHFFILPTHQHQHVPSPLQISRRSLSPTHTYHHPPTLSNQARGFSDSPPSHTSHHPTLSKRVGALRHPPPPPWLSKQARELCAAYPSPITEPEGSSSLVSHLLSEWVWGVLITHSLSNRVRRILRRQPTTVSFQMSRRFLCPFAFLLLHRILFL